jgi:2,3-bisphosphoglycerate-dependent phosphoglycerate mutase
MTTYRLLLEGGYEIDVVFTSRLKRAIRTVWIILSELNEVYLPVFKSWRLQERHYGALTGLSKKELAEQVGADLVQTWYVSNWEVEMELNTTFVLVGLFVV